MQEALEQLESGARERMLDAFMPKSKGNVRSAAKKFAFFMHTYPTLGLFRRATPFDPDATAHNEWILILFAHWLCSVPSRKTGRPLKRASIASYVSTVKGLMSHVYKFDITQPKDKYYGACYFHSREKLGKGPGCSRPDTCTFTTYSRDSTSTPGSSHQVQD